MIEGEWLYPLYVVLALGIVFSFSSFVMVLISLRLIKQWIKRELGDLRRWKWKQDGLFVIYVVLFALLSVTISAMFMLLVRMDPKEFGARYSDAAVYFPVDYFNFFLCMAVYTIVNAFALVFVLFMFEKMSRAVWSK